MEESSAHLASNFCTELRSFCSRLETSCTDLRTKMGQLPTSTERGSGGTSIVESFNDKILAAIAKVEALKALTVGTVSFEELFGHCTELYKQNEDGIRALEAQLEQYGYKGMEVPAAAEEMSHSDDSSVDESYDAQVRKNIKDAYLEVQRDANVSASPAKNDVKQPTDSDSLYLESLSLKDFGLSASSLAALCSEEASPTVPEIKSRELMCPHVDSAADQLLDDVSSRISERSDFSSAAEKDTVHSMNTSTTANGVGCAKQLKPITVEEFNGAPSWLKWQVSLELLNGFVSKLGQLFSSKVTMMDESSADGLLTLRPDDLASLSYAPQVQKACLLLLVRLQRLETGFRDGATVYTLCNSKLL